MAAIEAFVSTDAVRSALGVDNDEMPDAVLTGMGVREALRADLHQWLPTWAALYNIGTDAAATEDEKHQVDLLKMYAIMYCAYIVSISQLSVPMSKTDGKVAVQRFSTKFSDLSASLKEKADYYRATLRALVAGTTKVTTPSLFGASKPSYDPVTNQ